MNSIVGFVLKHGYSILFGALFVHQIGFPVPGPLFLLAAGAIAATGKLGLLPSIMLAVTACVLADWPWYEMGRRRGDKVLHFIHGFSRDPDSHDRRAKRVFSRYGPSILLVSKFIPGLDAVAPPLAGTSRTSRFRFFLFDAIGAALYSVTYAGLGYAFSHDLDRVATYSTRAGTLLVSIVVGAILIYAAFKLFQRQRSRRKPRLAQITGPDAARDEGSISTTYKVLLEGFKYGD